MEIAFEQLFAPLEFDDVINIETLNVETYDDGIYHYIHLLSYDVYSFDTFDNVWLDKNTHRDEVLERLNN